MECRKKLAIFIFIFLLSSNLSAAIKYVKADAVGLNNGTSWADAYTDLQSALTGSNDTVWVANGVYKPTSTTNRDILFDISGRKIFGGFTGSEVNLSDRNYSTFQTIMSGDIGVVGDSTDNSKTIVYAQLTNDAVIDGFKIEHGYGGGNPYMSGAGIFVYNPAGLPININNCDVENNYATNGGGGIYIHGGPANINGCIFKNNKANTGGAICLGAPGSATQVKVFNSILTGNKAQQGGAVAIGGLIYLDRCILSNNVASDRGGAIYSQASSFVTSLNVANSLIVGNLANYSSAIYVSSGLSGGVNTSGSISYSTIADNKALTSGCIFLGCTSAVSGSIIWGNGDGGQISTNQLSGSNNGFITTLSYNDIQNSPSAIGNTFNFDPLFISPGNFTNAPFVATTYNYRLQTTSPARDTFYADSSSNAYYSRDLDGMQRQLNSKWDLGCYDHCSNIVTGNIVGDTIICQGDSAVLVAPMGGIAYQWNNNNTNDSLVVSDSGVYTVIVNTGSCGQTLSHHVAISPLPTPTITQTGSLFSTTIAFTSYQWYKDNIEITGASQQQYPATQAGSYTVKVTNNNGCEGISNALSYSPPTVINQIDNNNLNVYPNPANKYVIIDLEHLSDNINSYSIVDIWGRVIDSHLNGISNNKTLKIDLQNVAAGSYYIKLQSSKQQYSLKLMIIR